MNPHRSRRLGTALSLLVLVSSASGQPFTNNMDAALVVGQPNFTAQNTTRDQSTTVAATGCAVSATGKLAVVDLSIGRIMLWNAIPTANGAPANVVVGKSSFTDTTTGTSASVMMRGYDVAFSPDGSKLIASDTLNNRVLIWNTVPTVNGAGASVVIGQTDFVTATAGATAAKLDTPTGVFVTSGGKLIIGDRGNNRLLVFNSIPTTNGAAADVVIGQPDMTTKTFGNTANKMNAPARCTLSSDGKLLVADEINHRVLIFNTVPTTNGASADVVIGQTGFGSSTFGTSATKFANPAGVSVSPTGQLAVSDFNNNRVLIYNTVPTAHGATADFVLGQPDFTSSAAFNGGVSAHSMASLQSVLFIPDGRLLVAGNVMHRLMIFGAPTTPGPVASSFGGGAVTAANSPDAAGADSGTKFDVLKRGGYIAQNGNIIFPGFLLVGTGGVTLSPNNYMGLWKHNGTSLNLLARSGNDAAETGTTAAKWDVLPLTPAINDSGEVTFLASLVVSGASTPATTVDNDTGLWSELGATGLGILMREGDTIPPVSPLQIGAFASGCFATAHTGASTGEAAFAVTMKNGSTDTAILRASINGPTVTTVGVVARENTAMPGVAGELFGNLAGSYTDSLRMDPTGNLCFVALSASNRESIWYQPASPAGSPAAKAFIAGTAATGDTAPGTGGATFKNIKSPAIGSGGTISFRGFLNNNGDNAGGAKNDGIWRGTVGGGFTCILRRGDSALPGMAIGSKVGNLWGGWLNRLNHGAWKGWEDTAGDGVSPFPADTYAIYTDVGGTMRALVRVGDPAPGAGGATLASVDHPVVSGNAPGTEHVAFLGTLSGAGVTAGTNDKALWRSLNGAAPTLVLRTGSTMATSQGPKTIFKFDLPASNTNERRWEQPVMDATGRILVLVTFTDNATSEALIP
ncbi:MAG: NHL repeat-containing protein [Verrucomicrobiaceae bacterium]|nr:NHL repeat-containing protein [Verrucomicrobiaceae bacterium]